LFLYASCVYDSASNTFSILANQPIYFFQRPVYNYALYNLRIQDV